MPLTKKILAILIGIIYALLIVIQLSIVLTIIIIELLSGKTPTGNTPLDRFIDSISKLIKSLWHSSPKINPVIVQNQVEITQKIDPRPEAIRNLPYLLDVRNNIFGNQSIVFYYEPSSEPLVRQEIRLQHDRIRDKLKAKTIDFIFPYLLDETPENEYLSIMDFYFPLIKKTGINYESLRKSLTSPNIFRELIGFQELPGPCFIRCTEKESGTGMEYRIYHLPTADAALISSSIDFYLLSVTDPRSHRSRAQFSMGGRSLSKDPDDLFDMESARLSISLQKEIEEELKTNNTKGAVKMMFFILKKMKQFNMPSDPSVKMLIQELQQDRMEKPSRLLITANGRIMLTDFNKEIELTPLQKTVFIFFLLREEGILFKDLPLYKKTLLDIYSKISNRTSLNTIQKSVNELANPYSNSMSEKCSRIREAFMKSMDKRLAEYYCIKGDRNGPKRIILDRSLVEFEDALY